MNILSPNLTPVNSQLRFNNEAGRNAGNADDRTESVREVFAELVDDNLSIPVTAVLEPARVESQLEAQQSFLSERIDLNSLASNEGLPLSNQQALASYQSVFNNTFAADASIVRLDIIV